ncbi:MAG: GH25 family lysozyme [Lachnospiraceae bacterium]
MYKGIDVSDNQGTINWDQVKEDGIKFAILRSVRGSGKTDYQFKNNVTGCRAVDMPFDIYKYSYADTITKASKEAVDVVKLLKQNDIMCTVWWDMEDSSLRNMGKVALTALINTAKTVIEAGGYQFGIYCNQDWYRNVLDARSFDCPFWVARYPSNDRMSVSEMPAVRYKPSVTQELFGWQYSSKGNVSGIVGNVDMNIIYVDVNDDNSATEPSKPTQGNPHQEPTYCLYRGRLKQSKEYVKWLQHYLKIKEDGIFGKDTDKELKKYQRSHGLAVDGKCGAKTVGKLKQ